MRIAMISEHASPLAAIGGVDAGGQNLHVAELSAALAREGHAVTVYTRRDDADLPVQVESAAGFDVVHVPAGPPVRLAKDDLLPYMRQFGRWLEHRWTDGGVTPDVIHAHFWMSGVAALQSRSMTSTPVVLTYHALGAVKRRHQKEADTSPVVRVAVETQLGLAVDRVVAQCPDEVAELSRLGVPAENVVVIPSGVDLVRFCPEGQAMPQTPGRRRVLTVGRLVPRKGYDDLIRAVVAIPDAELVIVGGPPEGVDADPEGRRLNGLAHQLGVADRVRLVGAVPRAVMPAWYRSADVLACTPWYEPFGLTPLEAMACGIPVVTYAVGGLQESVADGVTGRHVPPGDVPALTAALRELLADSERRRAFARAGLARARGNYSWESTARRLGDLYGEVVARRRQLEWVAP